MTTTNTTTANLSPVIHLPGTPTLAEWHNLMMDLHADILAGKRSDTALIFEPASVYSLGRHSTPEDRTPGVEFVDMDRGGRASWAGPGVVVGVPIMRLFDQAGIIARGWTDGELDRLGRAVDRLAAIAHERRLEAVGVAVAARFGVHAVRIPGRAGVWVPADDHGPARKLGNVGTKIERGITLYGIELHVNPDLSAFDRIVLCGLDGVTVTSLEAETGQAVTVGDVLPVFTAAVVEVFGLAGDSWTCDTCGAWTWTHEDGSCPRE